MGFSSPHRSGWDHFLTPLHICNKALKLLLQWVVTDVCNDLSKPKKKISAVAFPFSDCDTRISKSAPAEALSWLDGQKQHNHKLEFMKNHSLLMLQEATIKIRPSRLSE